MSDSEIRKLLEKWQKRIRAAHKAHYYLADELDKKHKKFGFVVVFLSALVGTSVFTTIATETDILAIQVATGLLSIAATILAALQTFLNYPEKRTAHLMTSTQLSSLKKKIEENLVTENEFEKMKILVHEIRAEWDSITQGAPIISEKAYQKEFSSNLNDDVFEV